MGGLGGWGGFIGVVIGVAWVVVGGGVCVC